MFFAIVIDFSKSLFINSLKDAHTSLGSLIVVRIFELATKLKGGQKIEVTDKENHYNALAMLVLGLGFVLFVAYSFVLWGDLLLPESASLHGAKIQGLWDTTMYLILFVFFVTHPILFWFTYKYRGRKDNTALYQTHNNKLEIVWTARRVPNTSCFS